MRYGRDYNHGGNRNWLDRAGETVSRWFGGEGGHYDRDYGGRDFRSGEVGNGRGMMGGHSGGNGHMMGGARDWHRVGMHGGEDRVRYVNRGYDRDMGGHGYGGGGYRGGASMDYGRDYRGGYGGSAGYGSGRGQGNGGYGGYGYGTPQRDLDDDMDRGGGMRGRGGMDRSGGYMGSGRGPSDADDFGRNSAGWGDYTGSRFRGSNAGGVAPGQYFTGYGHGGRQTYSPGW